jgi:hypothetical protein
LVSFIGRAFCSLPSLRSESFTRRHVAFGVNRTTYRTKANVAATLAKPLGVAQLRFLAFQTHLLCSL